MASADDAAKRRGSPRGWLNNRLDKHRNSAPGFAEPPPPSSGHEVNPDANQYDELRLAELGRRRRSRQVDLSLTELRQSVAGLQAKFSRMESSTAQTAQSVQIIQATVAGLSERLGVGAALQEAGGPSGTCPPVSTATGSSAHGSPTSSLSDPSPMLLQWANPAIPRKNVSQKGPAAAPRTSWSKCRQIHGEAQLNLVRKGKVQIGGASVRRYLSRNLCS